MSGLSYAPQPTPVTGREISARLYARLRRPADHVYVVTPFLQDYEFRPLKTVSSFLMRQADDGASVCLLTKPPEGRGDSARSKYLMLDRLDRNGVQVFVNEDLHAKVYLFLHDQANMLMLGSANLTTPGMKTWLEIALISYNAALGRRVAAMTESFFSKPDTVSLKRWVIRNPHAKGF